MIKGSDEEDGLDVKMMDEEGKERISLVNKAILTCPSLVLLGH